MSWLKTGLVVTFVFLWTLATIHCKLEQVASLGFLACVTGESAPHQDNDCSSDGCAVVESGVFQATHSRLSAVAPAAPVAFDLAPFLQTEPDHSAVPIAARSTGPPGLPASWQFVFRAAAPPRAPALVS